MIRMVVSDMDGTLLGANSTISKGNLAAIHRLQQEGIEFVIASGRDRKMIEPFLNTYGFKCSCILGNGAQYVDEDGKELSNAFLKKELLLPVLKCFREEQQYYMVFTTVGIFTDYDPEEAKWAFIDRCIRRYGGSREDAKNGRYANIPASHLEKMEDWEAFLQSDAQIIKVEGFAMTQDAVKRVQNKLAQLKETAYLSSFDDNIEVTDIHAQKGLILQKVTESKGLKEDEVLVAGDGMNDLSMFTCFPTNACAMGNAVEEIKRLAAHIVSDHKKDGFAEAAEIALRSRY